MGMILRIASSRIVGQGDIVGRSGYFSLNLSANSVMRGRLDARRTLKSLVADLRFNLKIWLIQTLSCGIYPIWMQNYPCCFGCNSKIRLKRINLYLNRPNRRFILKNRFSKWYFGKHKVQLHPFQHSFSSLQW